MPANTRPVSYTVKVMSTDMAGARHPDFKYTEHVPAKVVGRSPSPSPQQSSAVLSSLGIKHHDEIMKTTQWQCWNCEKPAVSMLHNPISYLHKVDNPEIVDLSLGICENRGRCDVEGRMFFETEMQMALRGSRI